MKRQPTPEQKAKAEERRETLRQLWQKISAMTEHERAEFAEKAGTVLTCEGHPLSVGNTILLAYQADNITIVGGFQQWIKAGRCVSKGQRALGIWIPKTPKDDPNRPEGMISEKDLHMSFFFGSVFDISQTQPIESE